MKISAVIITQNEEKNIGRCLESLHGIADEIVVVDSGSTDKTQEICESYGARFIRHAWEGYALQKNFANSRAEHDMILSIDADEALSETLKESISGLKQNKSHETDTAYSMNRFNNYCGTWIRHSGWYPDRKVRLFNRNTVYWENLKVHEVVTFKKPTTITRLNGDLLHYAYYNIDQHIAQLNRFSTLAAEDHFEKGNRFSVFTLLFRPFWRFTRDYFIKGGFRDGLYGYVICKANAYATFLKYAKLRQLYKSLEKASERS